MRPTFRLTPILALFLGSVASADVWYVWQDANGAGTGSSWTNAFTDLQDALAIATSGDEIRVSSGVYTPHATDRTVSFVIPDGVTIKGGYVSSFGSPGDFRDLVYGQTILDGDLAGDEFVTSGDFEDRGDNSYHVVDLSDTDVNTVLDGLVIRNGEANGSGPTASGGGLYVSGRSHATLRNVTFVRNRALLSGAGAQWDGGDGVLIGCDFIDNHTIFGGAGGGGGMQSGGGTGTRSLYNCRFLGNSTNASGGGLATASDTLVVNTVFSGNTAMDRGGAIYAVTSSITVEVHNATVYGNHAEECGGIHAFLLSTVNIYASVLWSNTDTTNADVAPQQRCGTTGGTIGVVQDSSIEGITATVPVFTDPDGDDDVLGTLDDDYHPIDRGAGLVDRVNPAGLLPDAHDLDGDGDTTEPIPIDITGRPRVKLQSFNLGTELDIGAYEGCRAQFVFIDPLEDVVAREGEVAQLSAEVQTDNIGSGYEWSKDGVVLQAGGRFSFPQPGTLVIDPVLPEDAGEYSIDMIYLSGNDVCDFEPDLPRSFSATLTVEFAADYNGDGSVDVTDLLGFLADWFDEDPNADFNGDGSVDVNDLLEMLSFWFQST